MKVALITEVKQAIDDLSLVAELGGDEWERNGTELNGTERKG